MARSTITLELPPSERKNWIAELGPVIDAYHAAAESSEVAAKETLDRFESFVATHPSVGDPEKWLPRARARQRDSTMRLERALQRAANHAESKEHLAKLEIEALAKWFDSTFDVRWSDDNLRALLANTPVEDLIASGTPRAYKPQLRFSLGTVLEHKKFGTGVVVEIVDKKVRVRFEDGERLLAHGLEPR